MMGWTPAQMAGTAARGGIEAALLLLDAWLEAVRAYWRPWGLLGEPALAVTEAIVGTQRRFLELLADGVTRYAGEDE